MTGCRQAACLPARPSVRFTVPTAFASSLRPRRQEGQGGAPGQRVDQLRGLRAAAAAGPAALRPAHLPLEARALGRGGGAAAAWLASWPSAPAQLPIAVQLPTTCLASTLLHSLHSQSPAPCRAGLEEVLDAIVCDPPYGVSCCAACGPLVGLLWAPCVPDQSVRFFTAAVRQPRPACITCQRLFLPRSRHSSLPAQVRAGGRKSVAKEVEIRNRETYIPSTHSYTLAGARACAFGSCWLCGCACGEPTLPSFSDALLTGVPLQPPPSSQSACATCWASPRACCASAAASSSSSPPRRATTLSLSCRSTRRWRWVRESAVGPVYCSCTSLPQLPSIPLICPPSTLAPPCHRRWPTASRC